MHIKPRESGWIRPRLSILLVLVIGILLGVILSLNWPSSSPAPAFVVNSQNAGRNISFETGFSPIVQAVLPAVVNVSSTRVLRAGNQMQPFFQDPFFRRFFGDGQGEEMPPQRERAMGSGVIVTGDGHILTNNHVVEGASEVLVFLNETEEHHAKIIGTDPQTDLAVLKLDRGNLTPLTLGKSSNVRIGQFVLAIGNPFGVGRTVTMGIVSATGRGNLGLAGYEDFIQTDAAINPGNSGGALVDQDGRLVGINTAILTRGQGNQGIGFAVPIDMARSVMDQIVRTGKVVRGYLGVNIQSVTPALAEALDISANQGALVSGVSEGGPAQRAGLQRGDVILSVDGQKVEDSRNLSLTIARMAPGTTARLEIVRNGQRREISIPLGERPNEGMSEAPQPAEGDEGIERSNALGIQVQELNAQIRQQLELPENTQGVLVAGVRPGSPASEAGLTRGDVIQEVNRQAVRNVQELRDALRRIDQKEPVLLLINRGGMTTYLAIER